jgi:15-cis-phytoene synthase
VQAHDRPRYYATLYAPPVARPHLFALYAFAAEVARAPDAVREPMLGEIRLQWWREAVERLGEGGAGETPVLAALGEAIRAASLPIPPLVDLVEARRADLYADPQPTRDALEGFLGETESAVFQLASLVLGGGLAAADASGHAGVAYGLARRLAGLAQARARGRSVIPSSVLEAHGLTPAEMFGSAPPDRLAGAAADLADLADHHLRQAKAALETVPADIRPAFLPLAVVRPLLARVRRAGSGLATSPVSLPDMTALSRISAAALAGWRPWARG